MLEAARNDIDLWLVDDRDIEDSALLSRYRQLMSPGENGRHQRLIFNRNRHQFLVTRALVRTVLADYLGIDDPASLEFGKSWYGKPELVQDTPLRFNITHTNGLIALAVMQQDPVGVDAEYLSRQVDIASLAERYFSRIENEALQALPVSEWNERFFDLWTLKEAYLKACGTGLRTPLHEFSFLFDGDAVSIRFSPVLKDDPSAWQFWQMEVETGYRLSLAVNDKEGRDYRLRIRKGIPLQGFTEITPSIFRRSVR